MVPEILWNNTVSGVNSSIVHLNIVKRVDLMVKCSCHKNKTHKNKKQRGARKILEVMDMSVTLIVVMVSGVHAYDQTHSVI